MKLKGEHIFDGPREEVWELMRDPEVLATALPGTSSLNQVSENEYQGKMHVRIGPVSGLFSGRILVSDDVPPESYTLMVEGRGAPGFAKGTGHIFLIAQDDDTTLLKYEGEMQIGGRLASVGQRLIDTASKSMIRQGLESLNQALQARMTVETEDQEIEYTPPSETEFAAAVAKDMAVNVAAEIFSPKYQAIWTTVAIAIIAILVGFWLGRRCCAERR